MLFPAQKPFVAIVPTGDSVLYSARISPFKYETQGGFLLKLTMYFPEGTEHWMHLTQNDLIIEPAAPKPGRYLLSGVLVAALGFAIGGLGDAVDGVGKVLEVKGAQEGYEGQYVVIPYKQISRLDTFRQGLNFLSRIYFTNGHEKGFAFAVFPPGKSLSTANSTNEWVSLIRRSAAG